MAKTQLNVRVDEATAETARERASQRGISVNRYIEELVRQDEGENGRTFVEAAADFMKRYESLFAEESGAGSASAPAPVPAEAVARPAGGEATDATTDAAMDTVTDASADAAAVTDTPGGTR
jgi:hypothetical protein